MGPTFRSRGRSAVIQAQTAAIIAMSQFKLNQLDKAQTALADCNEVIESNSEDLRAA